MADKKMMVPSRVTTDLLTSYQAIKGTLKTNGEDLVRALSTQVPPSSRFADSGDDNGFRGTVARIEEHLDRGHQSFLDRDRIYRGLRAELQAAQEERLAAAEALRAAAIPVRDAALQLYGVSQGHKLGFARQIPQNPMTLLEHGTTLVARLADLAYEVTPKVEGFQADRGQLTASLAPWVDRLRQAIDDVDLRRRRTERAQLSRSEAVNSYTRIFLGCARTLEALFLMVGMPEQAARVRPSARRQGLTLNVANSGDDSQDDSGQDDSGQDDSGQDDSEEDDSNPEPSDPDGSAQDAFAAETPDQD